MHHNNLQLNKGYVWVSSHFLLTRNIRERIKDMRYHDCSKKSETAFDESFSFSHSYQVLHLQKLELTQNCNIGLIVVGNPCC